MKRCGQCAGNDGMIERPNGDIDWCDHGVLERAVAAAEARDRVVAARRRIARGETP